MQIAIPIREISDRSQRKEISRGQLYNLDDDQWFQFQFNPVIRPTTDIGWSDDIWTGTDMTHAQYLGTAQTEFNISLLFMVEPGAPKVRSERCSISPMIGDYVSIENIYEILRQWQLKRPAEQRPSLIAYIEPGSEDFHFSGRVMSLSISKDRRFPNGRLRRATINIGFKQWRTPDRPR